MARLKKYFTSATFYWRVGLLLVATLCVAELGVLWFSGAQETKDAFASGRRLILPLDGGAIMGKQLLSPEAQAKLDSEAATIPPAEPVKVEEEKPADASPPAEVAASSTGTSDKAPIAKAAPVTPVTDVVDVAPPVENMAAITPSDTPTAAKNTKLLEATSSGDLPKIASDGTKPWKYYAKPFTKQGDLPMVAVIITGLGQSKQASERALRLPEAVSLSFSPYSKNLNSWISSVRSSGHELLLDLPMEPSNFPVTDPGPLGLLATKDQDQNDEKIKKLMASATGYVGLLTPQDEVLSSDIEMYKSFLQVLSGRGLLLVMGRAPHKKETQDLMEKNSGASVVADTLIDEELTETAIQARLEVLEQTAKQRGYAIGVAQGFPITIEQISAWSSTLAEKGIVLVPVSLIAKQRFP